ncbi:guanosine-5'-triphosphate,3'-diphosphate pyrophosphatase [Thalassotalea euphylliae]|uniref:Ppx/GppA phosphatase family protein n=1 Tax=Thalassotalea euphylliae TaxID=1655234 RepID=UPI0036402E2D
MESHTAEDSMQAHPATSTSPLYAVIDLGSNSFHMLITRLVADGVQIVDKVKRKVRLASGLDEQNNLSQEAMSRGLECLSFFAERLQDIAPENIRIVATATLRIATNGQEFITKANEVLGHQVRLLSGIEEAERIYLGVAHTSDCGAKKLVLDIGGASTELVIGEHFSIHQASSLNMGCVTFNQRFFEDGHITLQRFERAVADAKSQLLPLLKDYTEFGWQSVLGGSGTMQALAEILMHRKLPAIVTLPFMHDLKQQAITSGDISNIDIDGLTSDRKPVFVSGLAILIALFESFEISALQLSSGALREGLLYEMLPDMRKVNIRTRTIHSLVERFHIDVAHADRVSQQASHLFDCYAKTWQLNEQLKQLLISACQLHEVGLLLSYKYHQQHGAYIIQHADLPGFDQTERQLIVTLIKLHKGDIDGALLDKLALVDKEKASQLLAIFRLAVILCRRRQDEVLPEYTTDADKHTIKLCLPSTWLEKHPLIADELLHENDHLATLGLSLVISC